MRAADLHVGDVVAVQRGDHGPILRAIVLDTRARWISDVVDGRAALREAPPGRRRSAWDPVVPGLALAVEGADRLPYYSDGRVSDEWFPVPVAARWIRHPWAEQERRNAERIEQARLAAIANAERVEQRLRDAERRRAEWEREAARREAAVAEAVAELDKLRPTLTEILGDDEATIVFAGLPGRVSMPTRVLADLVDALTAHRTAPR